MKQRRAKILIRHYRLRDYRLKFFRKICDNYEVKFIWGREHNINHGMICEEKVLPFVKSYFDIKLLYGNIKYLFVEDYDVYFSSVPFEKTTLLGILVSKILNKKVVIWEEGWSYCLKKGKKHSLAILFYTIVLKHIVDSYFISSEKTKKFMELIKVNSQKIFQHPQCSIDLNMYRKNMIWLNPEEEKRIFEKKIILFCGRFLKLKGLDVLLKAFSKLESKNSFLLIVGDGELRPYYERMAIDLELENYFFYGWESDLNAKANLFFKSSVFVHPGKFVDNRCDGWGLVINEAMSCSLPIITTNAVGCSEDMVKNGENGYVVKHTNVEEMSSALRKVLEDDVLREQMKIYSRKMFNELNDYGKMFQKFDEAIKYAKKKDMHS